MSFKLPSVLPRMVAGVAFRVTFVPLFALILLVPAVPADAADRVKTTAEREWRQLEGPDAKRYAQDLYDDDEKWLFVSKKIESGRQDWLRVAKALMPYTDGAFSEELSQALASALLQKPANVLSLLKQPDLPAMFRVVTVCDAPFPSPGKAWLRQYQVQAIASVERVRDIELRTIRDDCLGTLRTVDLSRPAEAYE